MKLLPSAFIAVLALGTLAFSIGDWGSMGSYQQRVVLPANEVHEGWYFAGGNQVSILGTVNGDAYVAGGVVEVQGTINGELIVAGGQVSVSGTVTDRIYAAGASVRITGKTGKSVTAAGGTIILGKDATVGENLLVAGGNIQIDGTVGREARIAGDEIDLAGSVKGNMNVEAKRFTTFKGALVGGNLTVAGDSAMMTVEPGVVTGQVRFDYRKGEAPSYILGMKQGSFWFQVFMSLTLFATALALSFLLPGHLTSPGSLLMNQPGQSVIWGFIMLIVTPVIAVILCITIVGIPLGILLFLLYLWILYTSQMVIGVAVGSRLLGLEGKKGWRLFGVVALGLLIVQILMFIPFVRILVIVLGLIAGSGSLAIAAKQVIVSARLRGSLTPVSQ